MDVIDKLVVELGLDPKNFDAAQRRAIENFRKNNDEFKKHGQAIEETGKRVEAAFSKATNRVIGFGAALLGASSIVEFAEKTTKTNLQLGRMSLLTDQNIDSLSRWGGVVKGLGGTTEGFNGFIRNLIGEFQNFQLTGESSVIPYFRALGVQIADATGHMRPFDQILLEVSDHIKGLDPAAASTILKRLGADDATIAALLKGRKALEQLLEEQKKIGAISREDAEAAGELTKAWNEASQSAEQLGRSMLTRLIPYLTPALHGTAQVFQWLNREGRPATFDDRFNGEQGLGGTSVTKGYNPRSKIITGSSGNAKDREAFIRSYAASIGINPDQAVAVARSEGLGGSYVGDRGSSFGDFQLHYGGMAGGGMAVGGLGEEFTKKTGLDARDPNTWQQQTRFALDWAKTHGWSAWHGWHGAPFEGIGGGGSRSTSTTITIDKLNVYSQASDAGGIAHDIYSAIGNDALSIQGQAGSQ